VTGVERLAADLHESIDAMVAIARAHAHDSARHACIAHDLGELFVTRSQAHGCALDAERVRELLAMDIELNTQGLEVWLEKQSKQ